MDEEFTAKTAKELVSGFNKTKSKQKINLDKLIADRVDYVWSELIENNIRNASNRGETELIITSEMYFDTSTHREMRNGQWIIDAFSYTEIEELICRQIISLLEDKDFLCKRITRDKSPQNTGKYIHVSWY